ncbi:hypothetical protein EYF80_016290 [Liparis tanakae]|uniref:Uncharacterized protein n=1 Tax=Liparis tanakae TaxID=230148 RepID=A0A4Z2I6Q8_9TELE|nr:hypothetical protein EYF80_016290 [Liparis tanakae]
MPRSLRRDRQVSIASPAPWRPLTIPPPPRQPALRAGTRSGTAAGRPAEGTHDNEELELGHNVHPDSGISGAGEQQHRLRLLRLAGSGPAEPCANRMIGFHLFRPNGLPPRKCPERKDDAATPEAVRRLDGSPRTTDRWRAVLAAFLSVAEGEAGGDSVTDFLVRVNLDCNAHRGPRQITAAQIPSSNGDADAHDRVPGKSSAITVFAQIQEAADNPDRL